MRGNNNTGFLHQENFTKKFNIVLPNQGMTTNIDVAL